MQMQTFIYSILITLLLINNSKAGFIETRDYELDYTNINKLSEMRFIFTLESGLGNLKT